MNEMSVNPFESQRQVAEMSGARAAQARESTEVLALLYGARQNPRDPIRACDRIRNAFTRVGLAEESQYSYQRGGTDIIGPSIRAAEAIRLDWGNMATGWRVVSRSIDPDGVGVSEVEAFAVDYETTNREAITFPVRHWRDTKRGGYALTDERDIYEICANQAQRRKRACILALIPGDVTAMAMQQAGETLRSKADTSPEAMAKMLEVFVPFGVTRENVEARIQRRLDAITPAQVVQMKRIYASLRDGISEPSQWFPELAAGGVDADGVISTGPKKSAADEIKSRRATKLKAAKEAAAAAETEMGIPPARSLAEYLLAIEAAGDSEVAALVVDEARGALNEDELRQLGQAYSAKWQAAT
jgi:hypothetical protein